MSSAQTAETTASSQGQTHQESQDNLPALKHKLVTQALLQPGLSKTDILCLDYLLERYNQKVGAAWPSLNKIAADLSISRRQAHKSVSRLKSHGFVFVLSGNQTQSNWYIPNFKRAEGWTPGWCKKKSQDPPENQGFQGREQPFPRVVNNHAPGVGNSCSPKPFLSEPSPKEPPLRAEPGSSSSNHSSSKPPEIKLRPLSELEKEYQQLVTECLDLQGKIRTTKHALKQGIKKKMLSGEIEVTEEIVQEYRDQLTRLKAYRDQVEQTQLINTVADQVIGKMPVNEAQELLAQAQEGTSKTFTIHGRQIQLPAQAIAQIIGDKFPWLLAQEKKETEKKAQEGGISRTENLYRQTSFYFVHKDDSTFMQNRFERKLEQLQTLAPELATEFC